MKENRACAFLALAALTVALGMGATATAAESGPSPFGGTFHGQLTIFPPFTPGSAPQCNANFTGNPSAPGAVITALDIARGVFSGMGVTRLEATSCIDPNSPFSTGTGVLVASNGDQAFLEFENLATPDPTQPGVLILRGSQWVTGGTGRFVGASGSQECEIEVTFTSPLSGSVDGACFGTIQFGSDGGTLSAEGPNGSAPSDKQAPDPLHSLGWVKSRY